MSRQQRPSGVSAPGGFHIARRTQAACRDARTTRRQSATRCSSGCGAQRRAKSAGGARAIRPPIKTESLRIAGNRINSGGRRDGRDVLRAMALNDVACVPRRLSINLLCAPKFRPSRCVWDARRAIGKMLPGVRSLLSGRRVDRSWCLRIAKFLPCRCTQLSDVATRNLPRKPRKSRKTGGAIGRLKFARCSLPTTQRTGTTDDDA